jgi:hypothetical protein
MEPAMTGTAPLSRKRSRLRRRLVIAVVILLPLAIHAVWDQVESTLLVRAIADIARRGEPVNVVDRGRPLATPEQRQSASLYAAAALLARHYDDYLTARKDIEIPGSDPRLDQARLDGYLSRAEPALHLLNAATPLDFKGFSSIAPELHTNQSSLEGLSVINDLQADILSARGEGDAAADVLVRSIRLQRAITIPFYRSNASSRLYGSIRTLLKRGNPSEASLQRLQAAFDAWPDEDGAVENLQRHRAEILGGFWPHPIDRSWALRPQLVYRSGAAATTAFVVFRPLATHALRRQFGPFEEALAVARQPWPGKLDSARVLAQKYDVDLSRPPSRRTFIQRTTDVITQVITPSFGAWQLAYVLPLAGTNLAMRRTAIAALAIERFRRAHAGQAPPSLDALVPAYLAAVPLDPYDGTPLKYKLDADSYVVYSVDRDRANDGGALYGHGSGVNGPGPQRRDIGIRVPLQ